MVSVVQFTDLPEWVRGGWSLRLLPREQINFISFDSSLRRAITMIQSISLSLLELSRSVLFSLDGNASFSGNRWQTLLPGFYYSIKTLLFEYSWHMCLAFSDICILFDFEFLCTELYIRQLLSVGENLCVDLIVSMYILTEIDKGYI